MPPRPDLTIDVRVEALVADSLSFPLPSPILRGQYEDKSTLARRWKGMTEKVEVVLFYGHALNEDYACFSNFYVHEPFTFKIPPWCGLYADQDTVPIHFAEKAIMLCKASLMGDEVLFSEISQATTPIEAKRLGRKVQPWNETKWQSRVCNIAGHVTTAKFTSNEHFAEELLNTKGRLIAEASPRDKLWGIGMGSKNPLASFPSQWKGVNVLGWALMTTREKLIHARHDIEIRKQYSEECSANSAVATCERVE